MAAAKEPSNGARRGRPLKFGRPGQAVAVTLPAEVVRGLRKIHPDLGWAIVALFQKRRSPVDGSRAPVSELVKVAGRRWLIVVNREVFKNLPGVNIIPLHGDRAFLAMQPGRGIADLELAVLDRLSDPSLDTAEQKALQNLRSQLRQWRHDRTLRCEERAIIVVERVGS
jgi:hypothetical protein